MIMPGDAIPIYATDWCGDCKRTRRFFETHNIPYQWINIDHDPEGERFVLSQNNGNRSVPTIILHDGRIIVEPSNLQLSEIFADQINKAAGAD
jgi:glutaredoxin-like protein